MKKDNNAFNKKLGLIIGIMVIIVFISIITIIRLNKFEKPVDNPNDNTEENNNTNEETNLEEGPTMVNEWDGKQDPYYSNQNEVGNYKLESDKTQTIADMTFYNFKMKDYKNGEQKVELMVKNDGKNASAEVKAFTLELINEKEGTVHIMQIYVKSLKPGESRLIETHIPKDATGIKGFRLFEDNSI